MGSLERKLEVEVLDKIELEKRMDFVKHKPGEERGTKAIKVETWNENWVARQQKVLSFHTIDNLGMGNLL